MMETVLHDDPRIEVNESQQRFEARVGSELAFISYLLKDDELVLVHTEVPTPLEGQGLAGKLARASLDYAREKGLRVIPLCPFVASYLRRHEEYHNLIHPAYLKRLLQDEASAH